MSDCLSAKDFTTLENRFGKKDVFVIAGLLLAAGIALLANLLFFVKGTTVVISVGDDVYAEAPLSVNDSIDVVVDGVTVNIVKIEDGYAYMFFADCPDKLCIHQGRIRREGENIVCLPNRVVVSIRGGERSEIDAISG